MGLNTLVALIIYLIAAPLVGGILAGWDRRLTARLQSRVGPPILQPFYDVLKLMSKENLVVRMSQNFYVLFFLILVIFTGALFFTGGDLLLVIFSLTLAAVFFALAGFKTSSSYSFLGAQRELIQMMAYEPMIILAAVGMFMVAKSFAVSDILACPLLLIAYLPGIFLGFLFILIIKFRKSPFDLSMSHHAHQELARGIITEFSGSTLAMIEIAHWYENVLLLGFVGLFFANNLWLAVIAALASYFVLIFIDNTFARVKWTLALRSSWIVTLVLGLGNLAVLIFVLK